MNSNLPNFGQGNPSNPNPLGDNYNDPRRPTAEEQGFRQGQQYLGTPGADYVWWRWAEKWCPLTFAITIRTGCIAFVAWVVNMLMSPEQPTPIRLVLWGVYYLCMIAAIALPLVSLKALNWVGQLFWLFFFFVGLVWNPYRTEGLSWALLWAVVGSAVSEIVLVFWVRFHGDGDSLLAYRVRIIGRIVVRAALAVLAVGVLFTLARPYYTQFQIWLNREQIQREYEAQKRQDAEYEAAQKAKENSPTPLPEPRVITPPNPVVTIPSPPPQSSLPIPAREPDSRFSLFGQPAAPGPPSLSYLFDDIRFESGEAPSQATYDAVARMLDRGEIREEKRFVQEVKDDAMWLANVKLAAEEATKRVQKDGARLASQGQSVAGMECRVWVLDYGLQKVGAVIFIHDARLQVECRR